MKSFRWLMVLLLTIWLTTPAQSGIIFGRKKTLVDPKQRIPELLGLVKTSPDEHVRSQAAEELRQFDPQAFPDIVPVLIDVLTTDPKASVRVEVIQTLGRFRPVSATIGQALEQTLAKDSSMRVRLQARSTLLQYHWSGYRSGKSEPPPPQTEEPPLADPVALEKPPTPSVAQSSYREPTREKGFPPIIRTTPKTEDVSVPAAAPVSPRW